MTTDDTPTDDPFDQQQVVVPHADLNRQEQFAFRRGFHATCNLSISDAILHKELLKRELLRMTASAWSSPQPSASTGRSATASASR